jgi:dTDP-4-amino-4,6-dideoxygalactose transaminase
MDVGVSNQEIYSEHNPDMIPYGRHSINQNDIDAVTNALNSDFLTTGPLVREFESQIEQVAGAPSITVTSGTAALHCAYSAIDVKPGDEIITPPITFVATQAAAALLGAKIVFADVQADTANIDPQSVEAAVTRKTKAIVAVDYAGHPAELADLRSIADKYGIYLIEDAAHSLGSIYRNRPVGSIADITTFSFFPTKNIATGEGGAISSIIPELLERAKKFSRQGLVRDPGDFKLRSDGPWHQEVHEFGLNYRLPDILCALGISQIKRLAIFKEQKQSIYATYSAALREIDWLTLPPQRSYVDVNWHLFPIRVSQHIRSRLVTHLRENGIAVQVNYVPAYRHPVFQNLNIDPRDFPESEKFYSSEISLPMYASLEADQLESIIKILKSFKI